MANTGILKLLFAVVGICLDYGDFALVHFVEDRSSHERIVGKDGICAVLPRYINIIAYAAVLVSFWNSKLPNVVFAKRDVGGALCISVLICDKYIHEEVKRGGMDSQIMCPYRP